MVGAPQAGPEVAPILEPQPVRFLRGARVYRSRQRQLADGLCHLFERQIPFEALETGMHLVLPLTNETDDQGLSTLCAGRKLVLRPLSPYYLGRQRRKGLLFGFSAFNSTEIIQGLNRLAAFREDIAPFIPSWEDASQGGLADRTA
jgi:GntR family transcriptional regulator/MocR family aminotransferase